MLELPAIILVFVSIFGFLNHKYLKLPLTVGLVLIALISGLGVLLIEALVPSLQMSETIKNWLDAIDFNRTLMNGMLSFLLFAGALHVDLNNLMKAKLHVSILATFGVILSTLSMGHVFII
jgi:CPA1 family monovalent cation:H+ antiporter